eukprot:10486866-Heterocapsa_arctica.AAC.1
MLRQWVAGLDHMTHNKCLKFYLASCIAFGAKAFSYLNQASTLNQHISLGVERQLHGAKLKQQSRILEKSGWKTYVCLAQETGQGGSSGGTWVLARRHIAPSHSRSMKSVQEKNTVQLTGDQWTAAALRMAGFDLVPNSAYVKDSIGPVGHNLQRMHAIAAV